MGASGQATPISNKERKLKAIVANVENRLTVIERKLDQLIKPEPWKKPSR